MEIFARVWLAKFVKITAYTVIVLKLKREAESTSWGRDRLMSGFPVLIELSSVHVGMVERKCHCQTSSSNMSNEILLEFWSDIYSPLQLTLIFHYSSLAVQSSAVWVHLARSATPPSAFCAPKTLALWYELLITSIVKYESILWWCNV